MKYTMLSFHRPFDKLLDATIFFSFDQSGFRRHQRSFNPADMERSMAGKHCIISGGNSGLGFQTAKSLAERSATVHLLCRDLKRGIDAQNRIRNLTNNARVHCHQVDVSSSHSISTFVESFTPKQIDVLIHNAGVLPKTREITKEGFETTVATHVIGPYLLTDLLKEKLNNARVILVSSGGMYTKKLNVTKMLDNSGSYDGVSAYAMTKRAQVVLAELIAPAFADRQTTVNSMHPGWAATPGVSEALPGFSRFMQNRLRTPSEGADTIVWLALSAAGGQYTGKFWFDRQMVSPYLLPGTREDLATRHALADLCRQAARGERL